MSTRHLRFRGIAHGAFAGSRKVLSWDRARCFLVGSHQGAFVGSPNVLDVIAQRAALAGSRPAHCKITSSMLETVATEHLETRDRDSTGAPVAAKALWGL